MITDLQLLYKPFFEIAKNKRKEQGKIGVEEGKNIISFEVRLNPLL